MSDARICDDGWACLAPDCSCPRPESGSGRDLARRLLASIGHCVSCPQTQRAVREVNQQIIAEGRRPATVTKRDR